MSTERTSTREFTVIIRDVPDRISELELIDRVDTAVFQAAWDMFGCVPDDITVTVVDI